MKKSFDVAVIGAGFAGIVCAQQLKQAGYDVVVVEKSRGVGGRLATRRLQDTCADHGVRYLAAQGELTAVLIETLVRQGILQPWQKPLGQYSFSDRKTEFNSDSYYAAASGLTSVAKFLANGLEIQRGQRVQAITPIGSEWQLELESLDGEARSPLIARSIVLAIPAPQALMLLEPLIQQGFSEELVQQVRSVEFDPCLTVIASYAAEQQTDLDSLPWQAVQLTDSAELSWLSYEGAKRSNSSITVMVAQSTAEFAAQHFEAPDLQAVGRQLLQAGTALIPWLDRPIDLQVHRWRYAFVRQALKSSYLATNKPLPLVCSGDWCGGNRIEDALNSGFAAANQIQPLDNEASSIAATVTDRSLVSHLKQLLKHLQNQT